MDKQESLANAKGSARQPWYTGQKSLYTYSTITSSYLAGISEENFDGVVEK